MDTNSESARGEGDAWNLRRSKRQVQEQRARHASRVRQEGQVPVRYHRHRDCGVGGDLVVHWQESHPLESQQVRGEDHGQGAAEARGRHQGDREGGVPVGRVGECAQTLIFKGNKVTFKKNRSKVEIREKRAIFYW